MKTENSKHTPGPWVPMHDKRLDQFTVYGPLKDGERWEPKIAVVQYNNGHTTKEVAEANAELIASVPSLLSEVQSLREVNKELVEALEIADKYMKEFGCTDQHVFDRVENTLNKAKKIIQK